MCKKYKFIEEDRNLCKEDISEIEEWLKHNDINKMLTISESNNEKINRTLLEIAINNNALEVVKFLVENGADLYYCSDSQWNTLLEIAADCGHLDILKYLIENGFDKKIFLNDNSLIYAASRNFTEIIKYLVEQGKDIEQKQKAVPVMQHYYPDGDCYTENISEEQKLNTIGPNALRMAAQENSIESVKLLCKLGANVNVDDGFGTPLYSAAGEGNLEIVKILLEYGADINCVNENNVTPYHIAICYGHKEVAEYLLSCGADTTIIPINQDEK